MAEQAFQVFDLNIKRFGKLPQPQNLGDRHGCSVLLEIRGVKPLEKMMMETSFDHNGVTYQIVDPTTLSFGLAEKYGIIRTMPTPEAVASGWVTLDANGAIVTEDGASPVNESAWVCKGLFTNDAWQNTPSKVEGKYFTLGQIAPDGSQLWIPKIGDEKEMVRARYVDGPIAIENEWGEEYIPGRKFFIQPNGAYVLTSVEPSSDHWLNAPRFFTTNYRFVAE